MSVVSRVKYRTKKMAKRWGMHIPWDVTKKPGWNGRRKELASIWKAKRKYNPKTKGG